LHGSGASSHLLKSDFALESSAFQHVQAIPRRHTCAGEDVSPPLGWRTVPDGARYLALIVDDPDAPGGVFTHWIAWGLDPRTAGLAEGEAAPGEGRNDFGTTGYRGPCPPPGDGPHRYLFRLYRTPATHVPPPAGTRASPLTCP
jgi:Raf kinase inhibitor-like YbhB/YbcL family protein